MGGRPVRSATEEATEHGQREVVVRDCNVLILAFGQAPPDGET